METAVTILITSALASTGLLAIAAAGSNRHWFLRTAGFLAMLLPLLFVPAYEPFVALTLEGAMVALGVQLGRWRSNRKTNAPAGETSPQAARRPLRFSMETLLLTMVLCGLAAFIAARLPALNHYAWQSVILIGVTGALATLLGYFAARQTGWRRWLAAAAACIAGVAIGCLPAYGDWFVDSLFNFAQWPPDLSTPTWPFVLKEVRPLWLLIASAVVCSVFLVCLLTVRALSSLGLANTKRPRLIPTWMTYSLTIVVTAAIFTPAAACLYVLLTPEPIPRIQLPQPNAFDDFKAAGRLIANTPIARGFIEYDTATRSQLQKELNRSAAALIRARLGLTREHIVPVDYASTDLVSFNHLSERRNIARLMAAHGRLYLFDSQPDRALDTQLEIIDFGSLSSRGGLMVDLSVGLAIVGEGTREIYRTRDRLDAVSCRRGAARIWAAIDAMEPIDQVMERERIWCQHASHWHGRLVFTLNEFTGEHFLDSFDAIDRAYHKRIAALRLLALELLLVAKQLETGHSPEMLESLAVEAPPQAIIDPFDPARKSLRAKPTPDGLLLYSIGPNGIDDGGAAPAENDIFGTPETGDLRLDVLFAPDPTPDSTGDDNGSEAGANDRIQEKDDRTRK